ncbi:MAG: AsmA-like C-terminal region-containing protein [Candidatus Binatia bacterium]
MRRWVIGGVVVVGGLAALVAVALSGLDAYLSHNRDWLAGEIEAALGRPVRFDALGVSLRGGLSARVENLHVGDDPGFDRGDLLVVHDLRVAVRLLPALTGRYEVANITLDGPVVTLVRDARGTNVGTLGTRPPGPAAGGERAHEHDPRGAAAGAALLVSRITIHDGTVRLVDRTATPPTELALRHVDVSASDVSLDHPIRLAMAAALLDEPRQTLSVEGTIGPLGSASAATEAPLDVTARITVPDLGRLCAALPAARALVPPALDVTGPLAATTHVTGPAHTPRITTTVTATPAAVRYGTAFAKPAGTPLELAIEATRSDARIDLARADLRLADLVLAASGTIRTADGGPTVDLRLDGGPAMLSGWDRLVPALAGSGLGGALEVHVHAQGTAAAGRLPALTGALTLTDASAGGPDLPWRVRNLTATLALAGDTATLAPTTVSVADVPVRIEATIAPLADPTVRWAIGAAALPAAALGAGGASTKPAMLRDVDARGTLRPASGELQATLRSASGSVHDLDYTQLDAELGVHDRVATLERFALRACDGTLATTGHVDVHDPSRPRFDVHTTIRGVLLAPLLASQAPRAAGHIEGRLETDLTLTGAGESWEQVRPTLRGGGRIDVRDGVLRDVNLAESVLGGATGVPGLATLVPARVRTKYAALFSTGDTRFETLGATVRIADGRAATDDLTIAARDFVLAGRGTMQLDGPLDCTATLRASRELSADIAAEVKEARYLADAEGRLQIPFRVAGTLPKVRAQPDVTFLTQAVGRALVEKGLGSLVGKQKPGKKPRPEQELLRKGLDALFGQ